MWTILADFLFQIIHYLALSPSILLRSFPKTVFALHHCGIFALGYLRLGAVQQPENWN